MAVWRATQHTHKHDRAMMYTIYTSLMTLKKRGQLLSLMLTNVAGADSMIINVKRARHAPSTLIMTVMCTRTVINYMTTRSQVLDPPMVLKTGLVYSHKCAVCSTFK